MSLPIVQSVWCDFFVESLEPDHILDIWPEIGFPKGREALCLSQLWKKLRDTDIPGVLLLGCDVAADPDDYEAISAAAFVEPLMVHTGMVKLWPASTGRAEWMWSHRGGKLGNPEATQLDIIFPTYFSLGFLYVPRRLMDLCFPAHDNWAHGQMDVGMSEIALQNRIRTRVVYGATPKHLHFAPSHNR
jgi:hypothetical protein